MILYYQSLKVKQSLLCAPIEILADTLLRLPHLSETSRKVFNAYENFLGILPSDDSCNPLEKLDSDSYDDKLFGDARRISHDFRDGLIELFFDQKSQMFELTRNYGVF